MYKNLLKVVTFLKVVRYLNINTKTMSEEENLDYTYTFPDEYSMNVLWGNKRMSVVKTFNDEKHMDNWIDFIERQNGKITSIDKTSTLKKQNFKN